MGKNPMSPQTRRFIQDQGVVTRQIAGETICQEYDVPAEEATQDVMDFLSALEAAGLVRPAESP